MKKTYDIPSVRTIPAIHLEPQVLTKILSGTRKIFIAMPSRTDAMRMRTHMAIMDAHLDALIRSWALTCVPYEGIDPISAARNKAIAEFLASDCTDLVFWDDDIAPERGALMRLLDHPVDFVIGAYRYRGDPEGYPVRVDIEKRMEQDPATGLLGANGNILGGAFGFTRLTRSCVEQMVAAYPDLEYNLPGVGRAWKLCALDQKVDGIEFSEDMLFCKRWCDIGGTVYVDPEITIVHIGPKGFVGHYGDFLRKKIEEIEARQEKQAA